MIFTDKYYDINIIEEKTNKELQEFLKENDIGLEIVDNSTRWCAFAQYYAKKQGLNIIHSTSFAYIISAFFTDMGVSAGTEAYIREEKLEHHIIDWINKKGIHNENEAKELFNYILNIYKNHIGEYEFKTENINIRLTPTQLKEFQKIQGKNMAEKFNNLMKSKNLNKINEATDIIISCWDENNPKDGLTFDKRLSKKLKRIKDEDIINIIQSSL